jgi:nucleosome binding factor SPN SPT16 subunit
LLRRSTRGKDEKAAAESAAAQRSIRQLELMKKRVNEARQRKLHGNGKGDGVGSAMDVAHDLVTYKSISDYPKDLQPNRIKVDLNNEAIFVPINGVQIPFHITTIKNVSLPDPDKATYLRINFYTPGQTLGKDVPRNIAHLIQKYQSVYSYIKELTFRSYDGKSLQSAYRNILELRKRFKAREQKIEEEKDLVTQSKLIRIKDQRVPRLQDLVMRPVMSGKKSVGTLEAHQNGLRFTSNKGEIMDVMYNNIKHAIYQPCEYKSSNVLVHFHLKNFIMIGKKKYKDIQFNTEVIETSVNLDNKKTSIHDEWELRIEQQEKELKNKLNIAFKEFCKKVERVANHYDFTIEFDIPYPDLGFDGTCNKEMVFIMPSVKCLINITDNPFFVLDLSEVEHVHFERVDFATKYFDMTFIFYNHNIPPRTITAIEMKSYEMIQEWLTDVAITYTAGPKSLTWKNVMEAVKEDEFFYDEIDENGEQKEKYQVGWKILEAEEEGDEGDDAGDDEDEEFSGEGEGGSEDSSSDDSDESSFEDEEEEDEYTDEDDLKEEGKVRACVRVCV